MSPNSRAIRYFILLFLFITHSVLAHGSAQSTAYDSPDNARDSKSDTPGKPDIVVSIKPLHSLVASVMNGVAEPQLLLNTTQSAHHSNLRPSDYQKIADADIVFWAGDSLEAFIPALINKFQQQTRFISLMQAEGVTLLPYRSDNTSHHNQLSTDPHFWLSMNNARQIVIAVTKTLVDSDPDHRLIYLKNQERIVTRIDALSDKLSKKLEGIKSPFITYHDAYHYFEKEHQLNRVASISLNEESTPGIKQILAIKKLISEKNIKCIFYDAPEKPPIVDTLVNDTDIKVFELDAIGIRLQPGQDLWFDLVDNLAMQMKACLKS